MARLSNAAVYGLVVGGLADASVAALVNLYTADLAVSLGVLAGGAVVVGIVVRYVNAVQQQREADRDRQGLLARIRALVPFSPRLRSRTVALDLADRQNAARRQVRLQPSVGPERLPMVLTWMAGLDEPTVDVPPGSVRILVAPMGAGKTEQAARWWEEWLRIARTDPEVDIPIWLPAREVGASLESAVVAALGRDPHRPCRVVIDDLDSIGYQDADYMLNQGRQLVRVWPNLAVLATSRLGVVAGSDETLSVAPWPEQRGAELVRLVLGTELPRNIWTHETTELLTSPLLAHALAVRLGTGQGGTVSRPALLAGLARSIIERRRLGPAMAQTWQDLARLACRVLDSPAPVSAISFGNEAQVWRLTETDLVVNADGVLRFALPVFEQHFGAQAITEGIVALDVAASADMFPRWRYAIAFAIATADLVQGEGLMVRLAQTNPAAASWVLDEVAGQRTSSVDVAISSSADVLAVIGASQPSGPQAAASGAAVVAGGWLREAQQALLDGLQPLAPRLARYRADKLTQWGVFLQGDWITVAESRESTPPPEVVELPDSEPEITIAAGWNRRQQFSFPHGHLGRWHWARGKLRVPLAEMIRRGVLPVPSTSRLAAERLWLLAQLATRGGTNWLVDTIALETLRQKVAEMMVTVNGAVSARWDMSGHVVESADVRWLEAELAAQTGSELTRPWPSPDLHHNTRKWAWEGYSPELTHSILTAVIHDAIVGYRELVELNFPASVPHWACTASCRSTLRASSRGTTTTTPTKITSCCSC
ncbi:NACHT domain-containing protein [Dactylosporangium darangshiense]|uniref:hypothetical protein n=1 Tax=Dactylosporangium darangshiense TaxID=579108 RepID=UPI00363E1ECF